MLSLLNLTPTDKSGSKTGPSPDYSGEGSYMSVLGADKAFTWHDTFFKVTPLIVGEGPGVRLNATEVKRVPNLIAKTSNFHC